MLFLLGHEERPFLKRCSELLPLFLERKIIILTAAYVTPYVRIEQPAREAKSFYFTARTWHRVRGVEYPPGGTCQAPINQSINQPTNQSINQSINQSVSQSINQSIDQSMSQSINQPTNQLVNQSIYQASPQSETKAPRDRLSNSHTFEAQIFYKEEKILSFESMVVICRRQISR